MHANVGDKKCKLLCITPFFKSSSLELCSANLYPKERNNDMPAVICPAQHWILLTFFILFIDLFLLLHAIKTVLCNDTYAYFKIVFTTVEHQIFSNCSSF